MATQTKAERDAAYVVDAKEFKVIIQELKAEIDGLLKMKGKVAQLPRQGFWPLAEPQPLPAGMTLDDGSTVITKLRPKEYGLFYRALKQRLNELPKFFAKSYRKKRRVNAVRQPFTGFARPEYVSDDLRNFFASANLGLADASKPQSATNPPINQVLSMLRDRKIASSAMLTPLFALYASHNNLANRASVNRGKPDVEQDGSRLGADDAMLAAFGDRIVGGQQVEGTFSKLTRSDQEIDDLVGRQRIDGRTKQPIPPFDPNNFQHAAFQSIVSLNKAAENGEYVRHRDVTDAATGQKVRYESRPIAVPVITPAIRAQLEDPANRQRLTDEQRQISLILEVRNAQAKPAKDDLNKRKRKAKADAKAAAKALVGGGVVAPRKKAAKKAAKAKAPKAAKKGAKKAAKKTTRSRAAK